MSTRTLPASPRRQSLRQMWTTLLHRAAMARSRRRLAQLDDHILRDIGVTRHEAEAEAGLPAWDVPAHWRRDPA